MARTSKAIVYRSTARTKDGKRKSGFRFRLVGTNGKTVGSGEHYINHVDVLKVLSTYFPDFKLEDKTVKPKK